MEKITLFLPEVKSEPEGRPAQCPRCGSAILQGWQRVSKPVRDPFLSEVSAHRYHCPSCYFTFRYYPPGVSQTRQTERQKVLTVLMWGLGLSLRSVSWILKLFGISLSKSTVWRNVQEMGEEIRRRRRHLSKVMVVDGAGVKVKGRSSGVVVAVAIPERIPVDIAFIEESNAEQVREWLKPLVEELGVAVAVSDECGGYNWLSEEEGVEHQLCRVHLHRRVNKRLEEIEKEAGQKYGEEDEKTKQIKRDGERLRALVRALPKGGDSKILWPMWERYKWARAPGEGEESEPGYKIRLLINGIMEHYRDYRVFKEKLLKGLDGTTNRVEGVIGLYRVREKMARGFKSEKGLRNGWLVMSASYWTRRMLAA